MSKCPACTDEFSEEFKVPKVLPCGHTYCLICIVKIFELQKAFVCRECLQTVRDPNTIKTLPNNYAILQCIQQLKSQQFVNFSPQTFFSQSTSNPFHDFPENTVSFSSPSFDHFRRSHSPSRTGPSPDSFNFDGFKNFLNDPRDKTLMRSFTEPRRNRSKTPPRRINGIEYHEQGVFREKTPPGRNTEFHQQFPPQFPQQFSQMQDLCNIRSCNNPKMYLKGSLQQFCPQHYAEFNQQHTQNNMFPQQGFPQQNMFYQSFGMNFPMNMPNSVSTASQHSGSQQYNSNSFDVPSPQDSNRSFHKFGKPSALELIRFYEKTPTVNKPGNKPTPASMNNSMQNRSTNSSVFSSFGPKENQSVDYWKASSKTSTPQVPFPEMRELFVSEKKHEPDNRCIIPNCTNQKLVYKGMTYPFCGKKCYLKWQSLPRETPFWT